MTTECRRKKRDGRSRSALYRDLVDIVDLPPHHRLRKAAAHRVQAVLWIAAHEQMTGNDQPLVGWARTVLDVATRYGWPLNGVRFESVRAAWRRSDRTIDDHDGWLLADLVARWMEDIIEGDTHPRALAGWAWAIVEVNDETRKEPAS